MRHSGQIRQKVPNGVYTPLVLFWLETALLKPKSSGRFPVTGAVRFNRARVGIPTRSRIATRATPALVFVIAAGSLAIFESPAKSLSLTHDPNGIRVELQPRLARVGAKGCHQLVSGEAFARHG
jgi:hypothetical protein